jgi:hypothetical protein
MARGQWGISCWHPKFWDKDWTRVQTQLCVHYNFACTPAAMQGMTSGTHTSLSSTMHARNQEDIACTLESRKGSLGNIPR